MKGTEAAERRFYREAAKRFREEGDKANRDGWRYYKANRDYSELSFEAAEEHYGRARNAARQA